MKRSRAGWRLFLRSLLIQGSWNYRTLIGSGMAWALLPFLGDGESSEGRARIANAGRTFNAHPYFAALALGALVRLDEDGEDPDQVSRFRNALRGPLGSLGDGLVWAAWRPFCLLAAILWGILGGPAAWVVAAFLLAYNVVHFGLRGWGVQVGIERGLAVGAALGSLRLPWWAERIATGGVLLLGLIAGVLAGRAMETLPNASVWIASVAVFLLAGVVGGASLARWAPGIFLLLIIAGMLVGFVPPFPG